MACWRPWVAGNCSALASMTCYGDRLCARRHLQAQGVVDPAFGLTAGAAAYDVDGPGGLLTADEVFGPPSLVERRIDQLGSGVGLA